MATEVAANNTAPEPGESLTQVEQDYDDRSPKVEHELLNQWCLWFQPQISKVIQKEAEWSASLINVATIKTVEQFWSIFNNIAPPSSLQQNSDLSFFREGVAPKWEDPANEGGGGIEFKKLSHYDDAWLQLLLALIGEQFEERECITGIVANLRRANRIVVWVKPNCSKQQLSSLEGQIVQLINQPQKLDVIYKPWS